MSSQKDGSTGSLDDLDTSDEENLPVSRLMPTPGPGGTSAAHPGSDSAKHGGTNDNGGDNAHQSATSGGAPAARMYVGYGPEPEDWIVNGNPNDVFIDD